MYALQKASLQNSPKLCIHVDSSLYAFVSKVQYWLIKEGVSVENLQCAELPRKAFQRQQGIECLCRPSVNMTQQLYSYSASKDCEALIIAQLPDFSVFILKPGLGIIATQICCEDITGLPKWC